uniref:Thioredoxin domain-containing protein n=1 Tax=viral metagenome TaxID=1070528 RepID=A0A6C0J643_9ZZZZ
MNINSFLRIEILIVVILIIVSIVGYFVFKKYKDKLTNSVEKLDNQLNITNTSKIEETLDNSNKKIIQYYGGHHCPHSNKDSNMYKLINENLNKKYDDILVQVYWGSDPTHSQLFQKNNVQYVPTILNSKNQVVKIGLDENVDRTGKTPEDLENLLFENIYKQL